MLDSWRSRTSSIARARLAALTPGWVPTAQQLQRELGSGGGGPGAVSAPQSPRPPQISTLSEPHGQIANPTYRLAAHGQAGRALLALALLAVLVAAAFALIAWPRGVAAPGAPASSVLAFEGSALASSPAPSSSAAGVVVVDVGGLVRHPGVVELAAGARIVDALRAAGGSVGRGDTSQLNLAQVLVDGQQILVSAPADVPVVAPVTPGSPTTGTTPVNLNTATLEQLDTLPGIGPVLAQAILDWRTENGSFASIDQLRDVSGIGDATFADLAPLVLV